MMAAIPDSMQFRLPQVSQADISSFHATHFSSGAIASFQTQFLRPENPADNYGHDYYDGYEEEEEDDDGLGYYPDGVKRTLTDEQIAIFRHSELEALRRAEEDEASKQRTPSDDADTATKLPSPSAEVQATPSHNDTSTPLETEVSAAPSNNDTPSKDEQTDASEEGEIETEKPVLTKAEFKRLKRQRARAKKAESRKFQPEKKPDLRKRTWDVVETGMDSLYYDDMDGTQGNGSSSTSKRRQISYDD